MVSRSRVNGVASRSAFPRTRAKTVQSVANAYCLLHYAAGFSGGIPRQLRLGDKKIWIVPVVLTSPGIEAVGEVGVLAIDSATHDVVGATPRAEVRA
ncbi:MAG TPA: hypothetical protein VKE94_03500, partial [Gemmataceae bacterium]|nr:hypothetical protein [Gemmataceae bacterium]